MSDSEMMGCGLAIALVFVLNYSKRTENQTCESEDQEGIEHDPQEEQDQR
jgi:hypothetical protein